MQTQASGLDFRFCLSLTMSTIFSVGVQFTSSNVFVCVSENWEPVQKGFQTGRQGTTQEERSGLEGQAEVKVFVLHEVNPCQNAGTQNGV